MRARAAPRRDDSGKVVCWYGTLEDIDEQRRSRDRIAQLAHHDASTGLPNRALFLERLELAISKAEAAAGSVGVIYLDLDAFKDINDTLGHDAGDAVLIGAAKALQTSLPVKALAARIGGDEFAVLYGEECTPETLEILARKHVRAKEDVEPLIDRLLFAGGTILRPADAPPHGGYRGYVADPDDHAWEIAWNAAWTIDDRGLVTFGL